MQIARSVFRSYCSRKGMRNEDRSVPKHNWIQVFGCQLIISTLGSVVAPSMYQFITSPHTPPPYLEQNSTRYWPGLGGSDIDYAWSHTISPIVEFSVFPLALLMAQNAPFTVPFLMGSLSLVAAGTVHALATSTQMYFISRGLIGMGGGFVLSAMHTYMGEMGSVMDKNRERLGKTPRKCFIYIVFSFILNGGHVIGFAFTSVLAQFHDINPYRWPGWLIMTMASAQVLVVLFLFTETRPFKIRPLKLFSVKSSIKFSSFPWEKFFPCIFLICSGYINGQLYQLLFTLVTPILSDQFGFSVEYTSHFLIGLSLAFFLSSFIQLAFKAADIDNRKIMGLLLLVAAVGTLLVGDWQSLGPQSSCSTNTTLHDQPTSLSLSESEFSSGNGAPILNENNTSTVNNYAHLTHGEVCEALNSDCFWNPHSRITQWLCNTCLPVCLSRTKSLNFYQFSLGILLLSIASPLTFVFTSAISSDVAPVGYQGTILTLVLSSGTVSRGVSPYWLMESYKLTGRHTYPAAGVTTVCLIFLLLGLLVLYKKLAPRNEHSDSRNASSKAPSCTNVVAISEEPYSTTV